MTWMSHYRAEILKDLGGLIMTDRERLNKIKKQQIPSNLKWNKTTFITVSDYAWLIEQAEIKLQHESIVEALVGEETLHQEGLLEPEIMRLQNENKKLREELKECYKQNNAFSVENYEKLLPENKKLREGLTEIIEEADEFINFYKPKGEHSIAEFNISAHFRSLAAKTLEELK